MYRVLVPIDQDAQRAASQAEALIQLPNAREEVLALIYHIFSDNPEGASITQLGSAHKIETTLKSAGVSHEFYEASGDPVSEILEAAGRHEVNLVCLSGRRLTSVGEMLFGSVSHEVIHRTSTPVMICGPISKE